MSGASHECGVTLTPIDTSSSEHAYRMAAARRRAEWELGDSSWAGVIVGAYLWPNEDTDALTRELQEER